jgi:hypothetical protein
LGDRQLAGLAQHQVQETLEFMVLCRRQSILLFLQQLPWYL